MQINGVRANDLSFSLYRPIETAGGDEIWREYPLRRTTFSLIGAAITYKTTKNLLKFYQFRNIIALYGCVSCSIFTT